MGSTVSKGSGDRRARGKKGISATAAGLKLYRLPAAAKSLRHQRNHPPNIPLKRISRPIMHTIRLCQIEPFYLVWVYQQAACIVRCVQGFRQLDTLWVGRVASCDFVCVCVCSVCLTVIFRLTSVCASVCLS